MYAQRRTAFRKNCIPWTNRASVHNRIGVIHGLHNEIDHQPRSKYDNQTNDDIAETLACCFARVRVTAAHHKRYTGNNEKHDNKNY